MANLTDLIQQDAQTKCAEDVNKFCRDLTSKPFFKPLHNLKVTLPNGDQENLGAALYNVNYPLGKLLYDYFLPAYIEEESRQFYKKVKALETPDVPDNF